MIKNIGFSLVILTAVLSCKLNKEEVSQSERPPNIVFIFADDLGYGDIGCFGADDIKTPNIDNISSQGIRFTEFYSASPICTPSRAGLLTGRLPQRMGINNVFFPESMSGMPPEEVTVAEMLKEKNYATGIIGKWHLGHHHKFLPLQQGFDYYFGIPYSNDMESVVYIRGNEVEEFEVDQKYITRRYTEEALSFIEKHKENPFFLYVAHNMPHVPVYASENFIGTSQRGLYGDVVQELDWSVGSIIEKLKTLDILENTLVIFSSDNGPWLVMEDHGGSAGILREGKQFTFEGGMRVPTVAMWKGKIPEGMVYDDMVSQMDWFPTFAKLAGVNLPENHVLDGKDISEILLEGGTRSENSYLFFNGTNELQAYREGDWKIKKPYSGNKGTHWMKAVEAHDTLLINLKEDPGEKNNLYSAHPQKALDLFNEMENRYNNLGQLPPPLIIKTEADRSHLKYLKNKRNKNSNPDR
ncbi:sulfatase family protein [Abyssalbus ytuae]|uniref:Sulfatase n=1 Tax=Abyssalbus ytuae TaxID=2926907 RepID=A0A9E7CSD6_9FLAO|nr:sulfatase [Abyssalbus ytuae]UOB16106.1 sulfatase [Abyssalbus ytuae]